MLAPGTCALPSILLHPSTLYVGERKRALLTIRPCCSLAHVSPAARPLVDRFKGKSSISLGLFINNEFVDPVEGKTLEYVSSLILYAPPLGPEINLRLFPILTPAGFADCITVSRIVNPTTGKSTYLHAF